MAGRMPPRKKAKAKVKVKTLPIEKKKPLSRGELIEKLEKQVKERKARFARLRTPARRRRKK